MSKFTIYVNSTNPAKDVVSILGMNVRSFVDRTLGCTATGKKVGPFFVEREKLDRHYLRERILRLMALSVFMAPTEKRPMQEVENEMAIRYGQAVEAFLDTHLDLIAEVRIDNAARAS